MKKIIKKTIIAVFITPAFPLVVGYKWIWETDITMVDCIKSTFKEYKGFFE